MRVITLKDFTFKDLNSVFITAARKMIEGIMRTFTTRDFKPVMTVFNSQTLSKLEYCYTPAASCNED